MLTLAPAASFARIASPLSPLLLRAREGALTGLFFADQRHAPLPPIETTGDDAELFAMVEEQVAEFCRGERRNFDFSWKSSGQAFDFFVWQETNKIPYGTTITYGELAARIGRPGAARAVGAALGRNPLSIIVPCHRVVGCTGAHTGYAGGLDRKRRLLELEAGIRPPQDAKL